jgi:hypothetical protein
MARETMRDLLQRGEEEGLRQERTGAAEGQDV